MQYTLTVYREDDTTPWFEVSTDPAHPNPYLHEPGEIDAGEVDFLQGRATIGQVNLRVIDVQTGASQAERWLTERLGIPAGEEGEGHTALIGRRALLMRDADVVLDGVVYSVALSESFAGFELQVRDIRERARKVKLFERTGTSTIFPRGVLGGYGKLPNGDWLVPPTRPVVCTFRHVTQLAAFTGIFDLRDRWRNGSPGYDADATVPPDLVFTDAMREAVRARDQQGRHIHVQIRWRPASGGAWTIIDAPRPGSVWPWNALFSTAQARLRDAGTRNREQVEAIHAISVSTFMQGPWPQDGQQVELLVVYTGPASEAYPFHWEGTAGELLQRVYDGDWSLAAPGIRYDPAALAALATPVRLRVTEPVEDMREWTERYVYRAIGAAPALDAQGRISPVRAALPTSTASLPEITDANAAPIPGWEHAASDAINIVRVRYQRDFRVPESEDPAGQASAGDGIATREVIVEHRAPQWAIDLLGEKVHEIDGIIFRALGGADGSPVTGDITDETGAQVAEQRARETLDRWLFGGQISACRILAAAFPGLRVGDWVIDSRSWRPNYATGERGGSRLAQVMSVREVNQAWLEVVLIDAGPVAAPLGQPTLGTLTVDSDGVASVPVTAVPAGGEAAVYYAVSATQPPSDSPLWTFLGRTAAPATLTTPPLPAGSTVWIRARGEAHGRLPSPYTIPISIVVPSTPRVSGVRILIADGVATVIWQPNQVAAGVRIYWDVHPRGVPPTYATADVEAGVGAWTVPETMPVGSAITVEVEPWTGWTGTAVSGTAGPRVVTTSIYDLGGPRREVPFDDGRFAVVALDPAGQVLDPVVTDASGRPVVRFFAKAAADAPDTADAIPDGTTKRVTTIDEATGGARAFQGLLADGTVAPGKVVATSIQDGAVIRQKIAAGAVSAEHIQDGAVTAEHIQDGAVTRPKISAGAVSDEHFSSAPADKLATVKVRFPPTVELEVLSSTDYQITFRITARDADEGRVRILRRVVSTPSESYTTPTPISIALQPQPLTTDVTVDRDMVDLLFEAWAEDEDGNRSAIARRTIPRIVAPENALTHVNAALFSLGPTCPSQLVDRVTWTLDPDVPAGWSVEVWVIEGTTTGDPFSGTRIDEGGATSPFNTTRLTNVRTGAIATYNRRYGVRLLNSRGSVIHEQRPLGLSSTYVDCAAGPAGAGGEHGEREQQDTE